MNLRAIFGQQLSCPFWARVSHVHVYACLRKAYRLTSHCEGAWRNRKALRTNWISATRQNKIAYFIHVPAQKWALVVLRIRTSEYLLSSVLRKTLNVNGKWFLFRHFLTSWKEDEAFFHCCDPGEIVFARPITGINHWELLPITCSAQLLVYSAGVFAQPPNESSLSFAL